MTITACLIIDKKMKFPFLLHIVVLFTTIYFYYIIYHFYFVIYYFILLCLVFIIFIIMSLQIISIVLLFFDRRTRYWNSISLGYNNTYYISKCRQFYLKAKIDQINLLVKK